MKYTTKSRQFLEQVCKVREIDGEFYQEKPRAGLKPIYKWRQAKTHKYGKTVVYDYVCFYSYKTHKQVLMSYHSFIYAWYKGEVPAGYDIDHIDGDTLNNELDNLQLLTHAENLKKRGVGKNQFTAARENGLLVPEGTNKGKSRPNARKGKTGFKYEHTEEFYEKQALKRIAELEKKLETTKNTSYKYQQAKENAIKRLETELQNLKARIKNKSCIYK